MTFFSATLWPEGQPLPKVPMFLAMNSFMVWTSGVRMAMTGHETAVYPLFRTSLESACYAYLINSKPELETIWAARHKGEAERKASRKLFGSAVSEATKLLEKREATIGVFVNELYEASIDAGSHPNV